MTIYPFQVKFLEAKFPNKFYQNNRGKLYEKVQQRLK